MKVVFKALLLLAIAVYLVWVVVHYARPVEKQVCTDVRVCITDSALTEVVTPDYVLAILDCQHISPRGMCLSSVNLPRLDSLFCADPYISLASCHFTTAGVLCIDVSPRRPVLHVIQDDGDDYYVADNGDVMPSHLAEQGLCLASGHLRRAFVRKTLLPLACYIHDDEFWNAQIEQIYVTADGMVELSPRVGHHVVRLGRVEGYQDKLRRLRFFYAHGMPKVGWNKYKVIDLAYDGQIVCTK